ncbi:MAG: hypothetical protein ACI8WB_001135 [Phenylobacterium sp.]|jgi:hypothetical protein
MVLMMSFIAPSEAAQDDDATADAVALDIGASQADASEMAMPNMALLEYLAELVEVDGELVGPADLLDLKDSSEPMLKPVNTLPNKEQRESQEEQNEPGQDKSGHEIKNQGQSTKEPQDKPIAQEGEYND